MMLDSELFFTKSDTFVIASLILFLLMLFEHPPHTTRTSFCFTDAFSWSTVVKMSSIGAPSVTKLDTE
jgi:hypothetical protein